MSRGVRTLTRSGVALLAALSLTLAACSDDGSGSSSNEPGDTTSTGEAPTLSGRWPLTGTQRNGELPEHPVYVVKIDNTSNARPQRGLGSADLVFEELVEGGLTRLAAFYYEKPPKLVGPIRSMRATDIGIVKPSSGVLVAAGGAPSTRRRVKAAGIANLGEDDSPAFRRDTSRSAPYNLFADLSRIAADPKGKWEPPSGPYFDFGDGTDYESGRTVRRIRARFSGVHTTDWSYTNQGWTRPGSHAAKGQDFTPDTIVLLRVRAGDAGYKDPAGNPVPETLFFGSGPAVVVVGDKAITCIWRKADRGSPLKLATRKGDKVEVPPGRTFVELIPARTGKVTLAR